MLTLTNLAKAYAKGKTRAVDNLSLHVKPGEIYGFIGPNGAGKTTTIKMICGILTPDEGRVTVNGHDILADPIAAKRSFGYVPDAQNVFDRLTGLEYLNFLGDIYGVSARDRKPRIEKYLALFELESAAKSLLKSYSRGMRQKLTVAGALLNEPPLWILDEPMTGLDPRASHQLKQLMREQADAGRTVFFSTHVLEVAERLCDRIGIIAHGTLIAEGTLDALRAGDKSESLEELFLSLTGGGEEGTL